MEANQPARKNDSCNTFRTPLLLMGPVDYMEIHRKLDQNFLLPTMEKQNSTSNNHAARKTKFWDSSSTAWFYWIYSVPTAKEDKDFLLLWPIAEKSIKDKGNKQLMCLQSIRSTNRFFNTNIYLCHFRHPWIFYLSQNVYIMMTLGLEMNFLTCLNHI